MRCPKLPRLSRGQILRFEQHAKTCGNKRACRHTDQGARRRIQSLPPARRRRHSRLRHERTQIARRIIADSMFSRSQGQTVTDRRCPVQVSCASQSRRSHERKLKIRIQRERPSATEADKAFEILTTCDQSEDSTAGLKSNSESLPCAAGSCALKEAHFPNSWQARRRASNASRFFCQAGCSFRNWRTRSTIRGQAAFRGRPRTRSTFCRRWMA